MEFDWRLSVGNLITIGVFVISLAMGWSNLSSAGDANRKDISEAKAKIAVLEDKLTVLLSDLNAEKIANTRALTQLQADVSYTRQTIQSLVK